MPSRRAWIAACAAAVTTVTPVGAECLIPTPATVLREDIAFLGRVVSVQYFGVASLAILEVERVWKGTPPILAPVYTDALTGESPRFEVGETYVLSVSPLAPERATKLQVPPGTLLAGGCSSTRLTPGSHQELLSELGPGEPVK